MKQLLLTFFILLSMVSFGQGKADEEAIVRTLTKYIEGSTNGKPHLLKEVFHPDLNLYYVKDNKMSVWSGTNYILDTKEGQPTGETGRILHIDFENNAAMAKVEIIPPKGNSYIDYFLLLKTNGTWIIIHKMFTKRQS